MTQTEPTERRLEGRDVFRRGTFLFFSAFLSALLIFGMNLLNYIILALFSDYPAIASYGIVSSYTDLAAGFFVPVSFGVGHLLIRAQKENNPIKIQNVISTTLILTLFVSLVLTTLTLLWAPVYTRWVATPEEIREQTTLFLRFFSVSFIPIIYFSVSTAILGWGGSRTAPLLSEISALALHAGFSYIFVGLFNWDMRGIAISAVLSQTIASLINTYQIYQFRKQFFSKPKLHVEWDIIRDLAREEWATTLSAYIAGIFAIVLQYFINQLGIQTIAGFSLFFLFQNFLFLPIKALRNPAFTLSAERFEQGGNESLIRFINPLIWLSMLYSLLLIPLTRYIGPSFFLLFSHSPEVTIVGMRLVNLVSGYYIFYATATLITASLEGLGKKSLTMAFNIGFNYIVRFLVLWFSARIIQGDESIAICYPISWAITTAGLGIYYFATYSKMRKYSI